MSLPSHTTLPYWVPDQKLQSMNNSTPPARMPRSMTAMPQVRWTPNSMPAWVRKQTSQGTKLTRPQLIGTDEGIAPSEGNETEHDKNFTGQRTGG